MLTGRDKEALADKMDEIGVRDFGKEKAAVWYGRDTANIRAAQAVVLIGARESYRGVPHCGLCGFGGCAACQEAGGRCAFTYIDLGIAVSSAAETAALDKADNRIMFSAGRAAEEAGYCGDDVRGSAFPSACREKISFLTVKGKSPALREYGISTGGGRTKEVGLCRPPPSVLKRILHQENETLHRGAHPFVFMKGAEDGDAAVPHLRLISCSSPFASSSSTVKRGRAAIPMLLATLRLIAPTLPSSKTPFRTMSLSER